MKKYFFAAFAVCMMSIFTSCTSVESKAEDFVKEEMEAASSLNFAKAQKIEKEAREYREGLSDDDKDKFDEATAEAIEKYTKEFSDKAEKMGKAIGGMFDGLNDAMDELNDDTEESSDATDEGTETEENTESDENSESESFEN